MFSTQNWSTLALVMLSFPGAIIQHGIPVSCRGLFQNGSYQTRSSPVQWQPDGCDLKIYKTEESRSCLKNFPIHKKRFKKATALITFIGDSRMRQLRDELVFVVTGRILDWQADRTKLYQQKLAEKHRDKTFRLNPVKIDMIFTRDIESAAKRIAQFVEKTVRKKEFPDLMVMDNAVWTIQYCMQRNITEPECLEIYRRHATRNFHTLKNLEGKVPILWVPHGFAGEIAGERTHSNRIAELYNGVILSILASSSSSGITYWYSFGSIFRTVNDSFDGIHLGAISRHFDVQMLLNLLCNPHVLAGELDDDRYCCSKTAKLLTGERSNTGRQRLWLGMGLTVLLTFGMLYICSMLSGAIKACRC